MLPRPADSAGRSWACAPLGRSEATGWRTLRSGAAVSAALPTTDEAWVQAALWAGAALALAAVAVARGRWRAGAAVCALILAAVAGLAPTPTPRAPPSDEPLVVAGQGAREDGFVGSAACRTCHPAAFASWRRSHHSTMTQRPEPGRVLGRFDGAPLRLPDRVVRPVREGDAYFFDLGVPGSPDAPPVRRRVVLMTGSHHQQAYWLAAGEARKLALAPVVWLRRAARWVPFDDIFVQPAHDIEREEGPVEDRSAGLWNASCIQCHTTQPRARFGDSDVVEHGIACESCHGPAGRHIARFRAPWARYAARVARLFGTRKPRAAAGASPDGIVHPGRLDHRRGSQVCGQCHGVVVDDPDRFDAVHEQGRSFRPGAALADHAKLLTGEDQRAHADDPRWPLHGLFWRDGGLRVAGREYSALRRSRCYQQGTLGCAGCHSLHDAGAAPVGPVAGDGSSAPGRSTRLAGATDPQPAALAAARIEAVPVGGHLTHWRDDQLRPGARGDAACVGCHTTLASERAKADHSHHPAASSGARCQSCHMPNTAWSLLKATRDHEIRVPDPSADHAAGRPLACNLCHLDRPLDWSVAAMGRWWPERFRTPRPADGHATGQGAAPPPTRVAASVRWLLSGEPGLRALAAWHLAWGPALAISGRDWQVPLLTLALDDPYAAVRRTAARSLRALGADPIGFDASASKAARAAAVRRLVAATLDEGGRPRDARVPAVTQGPGVAASGADPGTARGPAAAAAVLQRPDGALDVGALRALLRARDDRDLRIDE